jgi:hypothetical protein
MKREGTTKLLGAALIGLSLCTPMAVGAQTGVTAQEAHAIAVDAYVYLYSLIAVNVTRKAAINIEPGKYVQ